MNKNEELEREAIAFYRNVPKFARTPALRAFLRRLADHLGWENIKGEL
jgi:rubrerythrin